MAFVFRNERGRWTEQFSADRDASTGKQEYGHDIASKFDENYQESDMGAATVGRISKGSVAKAFKQSHSYTADMRQNQFNSISVDQSTPAIHTGSALSLQKSVSLRKVDESKSHIPEISSAAEEGEVSQTAQISAEPANPVSPKKFKTDSLTNMKQNLPVLTSHFFRSTSNRDCFQVQPWLHEGSKSPTLQNAFSEHNLNQQGKKIVSSMRKERKEEFMTKAAPITASEKTEQCQAPLQLPSPASDGKTLAKKGLNSNYCLPQIVNENLLKVLTFNKEKAAPMLQGSIGEQQQKPTIKNAVHSKENSIVSENSNTFCLAQGASTLKRSASLVSCNRQRQSRFKGSIAEAIKPSVPLTLTLSQTMSSKKQQLLTTKQLKKVCRLPKGPLRRYGPEDDSDEENDLSQNNSAVEYLQHEVSPGPGSYNPVKMPAKLDFRSQSEKHRKIFLTKKERFNVGGKQLDQNLSGIISQAQNFSCKPDQIVETAYDRNEQIGSARRQVQPFLSTSPKSCLLPSKSSETPGPGEYYVRDGIENTLLTKLTKTCDRSGFGACEERWKDKKISINLEPAINPKQLKSTAHQKAASDLISSWLRKDDASLNIQQKSPNNSNQVLVTVQQVATPNSDLPEKAEPKLESSRSKVITADKPESHHLFEPGYLKTPQHLQTAALEQACLLVPLNQPIHRFPQKLLARQMPSASPPFMSGVDRDISKKKINLIKKVDRVCENSGQDWRLGQSELSNNYIRDQTLNANILVNAVQIQQKESQITFKPSKNISSANSMLITELQSDEESMVKQSSQNDPSSNSSQNEKQLRHIGPDYQCAVMDQTVEVDQPSRLAVSPSVYPTLEDPIESELVIRARTKGSPKGANSSVNRNPFNSTAEKVSSMIPVVEYGAAVGTYELNNPFGFTKRSYNILFNEAA